MERKVSLEVITIPDPCSEPWDQMRGDDRQRFCGLCHRNVYNLSAMPRQEAESLLAEAEERICVRLYKRADGTVTTADCAPERFAALRKGARRSLLFAGGALTGLLAMVGAVGLAAAADPALERVADALFPPSIAIAGAPMMGEAPMAPELPPATEDRATEDRAPEDRAPEDRAPEDRAPEDPAREALVHPLP